MQKRPSKSRWALPVCLAVAGCLLLIGVDRALAQVGRRAPGQFGPRMEPGALLPELRNPEFLKEINLSKEQTKELDEIRKEFVAAFQSKDSEDVRQKRFKELDERTVNMLDEEQLAIWEKRKAGLLAKAKNETGGKMTAPVATGGDAAKPPTRKTPQAAPAVPKGAKAVVSFSSAESPSETDAATTDGARLHFNFQYAPWAQVLELFAKTADLTLDLKDTPPDTFTYRDSRSYTPTQALDVMNGYLLPRGYLLVRRDRFLVSLNIDNGIPPNLAPQITAEELPLRGKNELVSLVIPVRGLQADQVVDEVRQLVGPQGKAAALKNTNSLVVTDIASNVRRVHALLTDETVDNRDTAFKAIALQHITASEAERTVRRLFGLNSTSTAAAPQQPWWQQPNQNGGGSPWGGSPWGGRGRRGDRGDRGDRGGDGEPDQPPPQPPAAPVMAQPAQSGGGSQFSNKIQVAANNRTNQLLVTASSSLIRIVEDTVRAIDTDVDTAGDGDMPLTLKIYTVTGGDLANIAQTINMIIPGVVLGHDAKLGKLHIQATADEHKEVSHLIDELSGEGTSSVAVVHLLKQEPVTLANTLNSLFSKDGPRAPSVEADQLGRRLIIRGTPDQLVQVKAILTGLGEGDGAPRDRSDRGTVRSLTLGGRDPDELLPLLKDSWSATRPNPIRIVVPSRPKPIRERSVPGADRRESRDQPPLSDAKQKRSLLFRSASLKSEPEGDASEEEESSDDAVIAADERPTNDSPISIEVVGDRIVVTSSDEKALDRLEELYEKISAAIPARTKWHVFYLRSADATEASQMIEKLFPQSNVATSTRSGDGLLGSVAGGIGTIGRGLMNVSGLNQTLSGAQTLRVVTDLRSNALYVSGPGDQVAEVEQILEVLDASELPESLRDRMPRTIAVEHADVEEVAEVVEAVFKDAMTPENPMMAAGQRGGMGGFNPLMMLMGGAAQQTGGRRQPSVQLTIGVDRKTNHLIVSCNDSLYQQIETLVQGIDERAKRSRQTVRVVKLGQADPTLVQQTLGSLMPKVTVGATRRSRRPANSPGGGNAFPSNDSAMPVPGGSGDLVRDAVMQRIMSDRPGGGGGGGGDGRGSRRFRPNGQ